MSTKTMKEKAAELLQKCEVVTLASVNKEGYPRPVPMSKIAAEGISTIWMSTGADSLKTIDFLSNPKAGLCFQEKGDSVANIEAQKRQRQYKYEELESIKKNLLSKYAEEIAVLEDEPVLVDKINIIKGKDKKNNIDNIDSIRNELLVHVKNKLEKELKDDKKQLVEIDIALAKINEVQLTSKK